MVKTFQIPKGKEIAEVASDGTILLRDRRRRRSTFKTPKATRDKIAAAAKKMKLPMLPLTAVGMPIVLAADAAMNYGGKLTTKLVVFGREYLSYYTGHVVKFGGQGADRDLQRLFVGLGPALGLIADSKFVGARRYLNTQLGRANVPLVRT